MKTHSVDNKSRSKNSSSLNFYNFKNNDFLKTNVILNQAIHLKTSPDEVNLDQETYIKLIKNNQGISGNLNARKITNKEQPVPKTTRNSSTPLLLPLDLMKVKGSSPNIDLSPEPLQLSAKNALSNKISFSSPRPPNSSQVMSTLLSPTAQQPNSARTNIPRTPTDSFTMVSPRGHQAKKSLFGMTPEEIQTLEKQILAKTKLDRDRTETISRLNTRNENRRDMSYFSDKGAKSHTSGSQNFIMSPRIGSTQYVNAPGLHELPPLTLRTTPEPIVVPVGQTSSEKTTQLTNSMSMKKNTDFTSIEEEGTETRDIEIPKRLHTASVVFKKNSIDYTLPNNLPPLGLPKGNIGSISGLPSSSLNDYLFKAHNLGASPVHQHHQGRIVKPSTAGGPYDHKFVPRMFDSPRKKMLRIDSSEVKKMDTDDLLNEIRREVPSVLSQTPATRQDVMVLSTWMNSKVQQIAENATLKEEDKNLQYDRLYNICINEVFRQVTLECSERGELIHRIWSCYFQIFSQVKLNLEAEIQRLKAEHQKESQRQYEWHQKFIDKKDQELENCKIEIRKLLQTQEEEQKNMMKLMHKNMKYKQKIDELKGVITVNKAQIEEVKDENRRYAKRLAYKIANSKKGTYVPTFLAQGQAGAKENLRESSVPEMLGIGSSIAPTPRKLTLPLTPTGGPRFPSVRITTEDDKESGSSDSDESSMDFVYEDAVTNSKQVFKIDHLNSNVVMHKKVEPSEDSPFKPDGTGGRMIRTCTKECQTNLTLAESKYDGLLDNQKLVEDLVTELKVKKEIDILAEVDELPSIDLSRIQGGAIGDFNAEAKNLKRTFSWQTMNTMQTRMMIEDRLDGLGKSNSNTPRSEFIKSLKKKLFVGRESEPDNTPIVNGNADFNRMAKAVEGETIKPTHRRVLSDSHKVPIIEEQKNSQQETKGTQLKAATSPKNSNYLFVFEPIQEQLEGNEEGGKSFMKSQSRIAKQSDEFQEQAEQPEQPDQPEEEDRKIVLEGDTEEEQSTQFHGKAHNMFETPVAKFNPHGFESYQNTPKNNTSIASDDLFHNLNEVAAEFGDVVDKGTKYASQIGSIIEADENEKDNQDNSLDEKMQLENQNGQNGKPEKPAIDPFPEEEPRRAFSLSTLINTKAHAMRMVSFMQAKKEDVHMHDKAKLLTVVRMYKVEKEKNKLLQNSVVELEEQLMNEKENQGKMKDNLDEMKVHIKMLEQLKAKCPHGKCSLCRGQEESEFEEGDNSRNIMDSSQGDRASIKDNEGEQREMDEVDEEENEDEDNEGGEGEGEDEEGDGEDGDGDAVNEDGTVRKYHRQSTGKGLKKKKKVTEAQHPQFAKKKEGNQNQIVSAAIAIINKVKDKKLTKFRNFMPIKSVLKNIHVLYSERINQAKDNSIVKDEEFFVFAYKWFHNNFGFRKIAEQKYIIFLLSVKKYLHIVRINLFARFMSLLQGSSNFTADEFSKYLEGFEIISNSTLGIPIVISDTDSKYYVPFLRGLEYLRYFSENKMATDEYIEFKREFEALKEPDPKNINRNGIVDIDLFMTKVLNKYRIICNRTKQFVVNAFKAADLDANKYCSLKEFIIIYRNIDPDRFDHGFAENLFYEHADIKVQGEINLSFDKFTVVCVEYGLFSDLQQDQFLGVQNQQEMDDLAQSIRNNWTMHYVQFDSKLNSTGAISQQDKAYWFSILKVLNERIRDFEKLEANDVKPILIAFKILENELEKLVDKEVERDAYGVKIIKTTATEP